LRLQAIGRLVNRLTALEFGQRSLRLDNIIKLAEPIKDDSRRASAVEWLARGYQVLDLDYRSEKRIADVSDLCSALRDDFASRIAKASVRAARSSSTVYRSVLSVPSVVPEVLVHERLDLFVEDPRDDIVKDPSEAKLRQMEVLRILDNSVLKETALLALLYEYGPHLGWGMLDAASEQLAHVGLGNRRPERRLGYFKAALKLTGEDRTASRSIHSFRVNLGERAAKAARTAGRVFRH
jgi:hypothetical protein